MSRRQLSPLLFLFALAVATSCFARGQAWNFLGCTQISANQNHVEIPISRHDQLFRTIQLKITGEAVFFDRLVVHFAGGASQQFVINGHLPSEVTDYPIDAGGDDRAIESVELWYYKQPWSHSPRITVYGACETEPAVESASGAH